MKKSKGPKSRYQKDKQIKCTIHKNKKSSGKNKAGKNGWGGVCTSRLAAQGQLAEEEPWGRGGGGTFRERCRGQKHRGLVSGDLLKALL